jgi:hypothetical protein
VVLTEQLLMDLLTGCSLLQTLDISHHTFTTVDKRSGRTVRGDLRNVIKADTSLRDLHVREFLFLSSWSHNQLKKIKGLKVHVW